MPRDDVANQKRGKGGTTAVCVRVHMKVRGGGKTFPVLYCQRLEVINTLTGSGSRLRVCPEGGGASGIQHKDIKNVQKGGVISIRHTHTHTQTLDSL